MFEPKKKKYTKDKANRQEKIEGTHVRATLFDSWPNRESKSLKPKVNDSKTQNPTKPDEPEGYF